MLEAFPVPAAITVLDQETFIAAAWPVIGRKVSEHRRLADVYETARTSIGLPVPAEAVAMFRMTLAEGRSLIARRDEIEHRAELLLADHADDRRLRTIRGVGPINALTILAEAGDLRRFAHHRQLLKFCGLDLATHQSRRFRGQTRLSKFGNARLRRTFKIARQIASRQRDNGFRDTFERDIARDQTGADLRRKALTAIAAQVARIAHAFVKAGVDDRPCVERAVPGGRTSLCWSRRDAERSRRQCSGLPPGSGCRLEDGEGRQPADAVLVMAGAASLTAEAAWITLPDASAPADATRSVDPPLPQLPDIGRCRSGDGSACRARRSARLKPPGHHRWSTDARRGWPGIAGCARR